MRIIVNIKGGNGFKLYEVLCEEGVPCNKFVPPPNRISLHSISKYDKILMNDG